VIVPPVASTFSLQMTDLVETAGIEPAPRSPRVSAGFAGKNRECARLFVAWFFGQYLDVIDDVLKR
jgi:hypothetical protein